MEQTETERTENFCKILTFSNLNTEMEQFFNIFIKLTNKKKFFQFLFGSTTKTRKTLKYGTGSIPSFSHQAKTRNGTI